jgi:peptide-methionine (S)-S-oxide reductase
MEKATFGAGCFWGVEEAFRKLKGVKETMVGYSGGHLANPTYKEVCTDKTGHAEVVQIEFDPGEISYEELLKVFFRIHDPTTLNQQGPDIGSQYRSVIFYHSADQQETARRFVEELDRSARYVEPIVTEILPAGPFYKAEEYHQRYHEKNGGSCSF